MEGQVRRKGQGEGRDRIVAAKGCEKGEWREGE